MKNDVYLMSVTVPGPCDRGIVEISVPPELAFELMYAHGNQKRSDEVTAMFLNRVANAWNVKKVIYHDPATVVYWNDGTKTVVKCDPRDTYSKEAGLAMCYMKKMLGSSRAFNDVLKKWGG